jgi:hypothetical protein
MAVVSTETRFGGGIHQWNVSVRTFPSFLEVSCTFQHVSVAVLFAKVDKHANTSEIAYDTIMLILKPAIILQMIHTLAPRKIFFLWWPLWILLVLTVFLYLFILIWAIWRCRPREKIWNIEMPGTCYDAHSTFTTTAAFNAGSDLLLLTLVLSQIWRLHMPTTKKIIISGIFVSGAL